ncbi:hypothetical protein BD324DRAFT_617098 [Kockovaella imperatae]|uniref:Uncharacterized protein n=1 Tax=Kockovaella imperatae TaxID=4999 RepID=A0A1Y1URM2_9TREE|nr:hypothetical protein BD324DRAFT_617098 [Kockovaella imperatae]ORX40257.1 hypothetical protein BD324DRAFT_617098 [Kockovaella imperatae]
MRAFGTFVSMTRLLAFEGRRRMTMGSIWHERSIPDPYPSQTDPGDRVRRIRPLP